MTTHHSPLTRARRGFSYLELLVSVMLLVIAAAGALAHWSLSVKAPASKRVTEMGVFVGIRHLERLKAMKYASLADTPANAPEIAWYDKHGMPANAAVARGYKTKTWVTPLIDRDGTANTEDLREIKIEVWDTNEAASAPYETVRTLLTFGGL